MELLNIPDFPANLKGKQPIVLFDGDCSLCSSSVRFLIRHNKKSNLHFASLQSDAGLTILKNAGKDVQQADTLLFIEDNKLHFYSTAALRISAHLAFPWWMLKFLFIIPAAIRDSVYRFVAANRYQWFGRKPFCMPEDEGIQDRFLA